jgi:cell division protein FtsB
VFDPEKLGALVSGLSLYRVVVITALFILAYSGFTVAGNLTRSYQLSAQTRGLQRQIAQDQTEYAQLDALRRYMRSDAFIETEAREEGLAAPGDTEIVVSAPPAAPTAPRTTAGAWWERYFGR